MDIIEQNTVPIWMFIFLVYNVFAVIYFFSMRRFLIILEAEEDELWQSLGSPKLFIRGSPLTSYPVLRCVLLREFLNTANLELIKHGLLCRRSLLWGLLFFAATLMYPLVFIY